MDVFSIKKIDFRLFAIQSLNLLFSFAKDVPNHSSSLDFHFVCFIKLLEPAFWLLIFILFILLDFFLSFFLIYFLMFGFDYLIYFYFCEVLNFNGNNFKFRLVGYFIFLDFLLFKRYFCLNLLNLILSANFVPKNFLFLHIKLRKIY